MAVLRVPLKFRRVLAQLLPVDDLFVAGLLDALRQETPAIVDDDAVDRISGRISAGRHPSPRLLVDAITSLYVAKCAANKSAAQIATDVAEGLAEEWPSTPSTPSTPSSTAQSLDEGARERFVAILTNLLSVDSFDISARATGILSEFTSVFVDSRIISDIRPIFETSSVSKEISASLIVHNLRISYFGAGETKNIFLTMDSADLKSLAASIARAQEKEDTLKTQLLRIGIKVVL